MSTLQTINVKHPSSASNNLVLDNAGNATFAGTAAMASSFLRNRIINGGMEIAQRGTSGTSGYLLDRWFLANTSAQSQSSDAPTGFINSLEFTSSSATFPFATQRIERVNSYDLAGRTVTFSLWAKNVSGSSNLGVELYRANADDNFSSVTLEGQVIVSASPSASWTFYTGSITLSASATTGIEIRIVRNNASAASTRVTGVQLEVGTVATPFERRQFGQELALCQRYFETLDYSINTTRVAIVYANSQPAQLYQQFSVVKRTTPTISFTSVGVGRYVSPVGVFANQTIITYTTSTSGTTVSTGSGVFSASSGWIDNAGTMQVSAEL